MGALKQDVVCLKRISLYCGELERLHAWSGADEDIDREFNRVCQTIWGYTLDDFDDDDLVAADHKWLDKLTPKRAYVFALKHGYDLGDYEDMVSDWWGFVWMILAETRGLLTPERRALAWKRHDERLLANGVAAVLRAS
ncbi:hypothetical protein [Bradyrhizobium sp. 2TAF24]|uniref:hypothetical protein n=1 Tax=Bradyrhizobium sp. 2TAF24 TaxID=3233011 RepID=UPI003F8E4E6F